MKAMLLERTQSALTLHDFPLPEPKDHQVRIKVEACALCRTDLHIIDGEIHPPKFPLILGHQVVGKIDKIGPQCKKFKKGDSVGVAWLAKSCGKCYFCKYDLENLCEKAEFTGFSLDGGFAEYTIAYEDFIFSLPKLYSAEEAAPLFCAGLIGFRSYKKVRQAEKIGFYGFGAAAHLLIQVAQREKKRVFAFTRKGDSKTQNKAKNLGAYWAGDSETSPPEVLDGAIIFASVGSLVPLALKNIRKGGIVVCAGIYMSDIPSFDYSLLWGEKVLCSVANLTRKDGLEFLQLAPQIPIRMKNTVYPLEKLNEAIEDTRKGNLQGSAVIKMN